MFSGKTTDSVARISIIATLVAAACSGDGGGGLGPPPPPPVAVASVTVSPPMPQILVDGTVQLSAQPKDADGNNLSRPVAWSTPPTPVATVSSTGLVTGLAPGSAVITATSEGRSGSATVEVLVPRTLAIEGIQPAQLVEGQAATILGLGFSAIADANTVMVAAVAAQVTQATPTQLDIIVPAGLCRPRGTAVSVVVTVGPQASNVVEQPLEPAVLLDLAVGEQALAQSPDDRCLQFDASPGSQRYVIGVQSVSDNATLLTGVRVAGEVLAGVAGVPALGPGTQPGQGVWNGSPSARDRRRLERWTRHVARTGAEYERQRPVLQTAARSARPLAAPPGETSSVPPTVQEGDVLPVRVPLFGAGNACTNFVTVMARVRKISARGIFMEDQANPVKLAQDVFDQAALDFGPIYDADVEHFGGVGDLDQNQRVVIVVTVEVNKGPNPPLAFVSQGNILPQGTCASSNEGEFFYLRGPDPTGQFAAGVYTVADLTDDFPVLMIHEFAHNIQGARRLAAGGQFMASWMAEGLATAAQELVGLGLLGLPEEQNYGPGVTYPTFGADPRFFFSYVGDWLGYFGFDFEGGHAQDAPELCTWVGSTNANPGPCTSQNRLLYGVPWSLIKHAIDRHFPGADNQKQILHAFSDYAGAPGFAALEAVLGRSVATLMAEWAPVLYIDDRYNAPAFQMANWNVRAIAAVWATPNAELQPRIRGFGDFLDQVSIRGGSTAFYEVSGVGRPAFALRIRDPVGGALPPSVTAWVVRVE